MSLDDNFDFSSSTQAGIDLSDIDFSVKSKSVDLGDANEDDSEEDDEFSSSIEGISQEQQELVNKLRTAGKIYGHEFDEDSEDFKSFVKAINPEIYQEQVDELITRHQLQKKSPVLSYLYDNPDLDQATFMESYSKEQQLINSVLKRSSSDNATVHFQQSIIDKEFANVKELTDDDKNYIVEQAEKAKQRAVEDENFRRKRKGLPEYTLKDLENDIHKSFEEWAKTQQKDIPTKVAQQLREQRDTIQKQSLDLHQKHLGLFLSEVKDLAESEIEKIGLPKTKIEDVINYTQQQLSYDEKKGGIPFFVELQSNPARLRQIIMIAHYLDSGKLANIKKETLAELRKKL